jgi:hypothetical protein
VLHRVEDANRVLHQIAERASGNLGALQEGLVERVHQIEAILSEVAAQTGRASGQVADQVDALRGVSEGALRQAADVAALLDERGRSLTESTRGQLAALSEATATLENVEARMAEVLGQRRQALEGLLAKISERSTELDSVTNAFAALIEDSLRTAEGKTRQIGAVLADSAQATTAAISDQFERLRATTGEDSVRTAASLRSAYEEVIGEMTEAIGGATGRFRDAATELRGMAAQIQRELEMTRAELAKGVLELPRETEEAAANMRRVVADQIKALNELSALVSRSNRAVDAAPAAVQPRRVNEPLSAALTAELRPTQASVSLAQAPEPPAPAPAPRRVEPAPEPAPGPAPRREAPAPEPRDDSEQGGWLSNLLTRASQDDAAPPQAARGSERSSSNGLSALDTISGDIARMIDHDAAVELWDRYGRGERNVFSRRLYTVQGQQTFDEIRRKYRREAEFKQTVDRYVQEFERLIGEVGRNDRDRTLTRTYLTSETGKVYTMLAHASGRFD